MSGLSVKLPLALDENDGFKLNKTFKEMVQQNLKNLCLTSPGEKCMDLNFGVGLRRYLFELNSGLTTSKIDSKIREQATKYMPFIEIQEIDFKNNEEEMDYNMLSMSIRYKILPLNIEAILNIVEKIN
jgi:phage baseplate assembly protein W